MVWKLLSGIAAAILVAAAYFAFISQNDIKSEREAKKTADKNLAEVEGKKKEAAETKKNKDTQLATLNKDLEKLKQDVAAAETESQEKTAALELAKKNLEQTAQQLSAVEKKIEEAGDIEKLLAQVNALKKDKEAAEAEVATQSQAVAQAQEHVVNLNKDIERSKDIDARARKGELDPTFTARITQTFSDWGFAVLNKGNAGGVVANADLDVKRGKSVVAKLKVRNVEQAISVVDIVPGTLAQGDVLRVGDTVVPAPVVKKEAPPAPPAAPAGGSAAPIPGVQAPATPAPAGADPFGAAPAAPAAGGAMAADPFGAAAPAAAPAAPAPAAADPFGAPAAPAAGAGTKASPSTADPFAK